jgi:hypothetical protein
MSDGIFIAASPNTLWPLEIDGFEGRVRTRWPDVRTETRHAPTSDEDYLAFELDIDGERRHGAYFDRRCLLLEDGTAAFWADTIAWFLSLLPTDAQVVCMTEAVARPIPMSRHADAAQIVTVLESLGG